MRALVLAGALVLLTVAPAAAQLFISAPSTTCATDTRVTSGAITPTTSQTWCLESTTNLLKVWTGASFDSAATLGDLTATSLTIGGTTATGTETLQFQASGAGADLAGKLAIAPKGTGEANGPRSELRLYATTGSSNFNLEAHNDADGNIRYRGATRNEGGGQHYPFYLQIAGFNTLYESTGGVLVTRDQTGAFDWMTTGATRGDLVLGLNANSLLSTNAAGTTTYHLIGSDNSDRVRIDSGGGTVAAGTGPTVITTAAGHLTGPMEPTTLTLGSYQDIPAIAAPGNPATGYGRLYIVSGANCTLHVLLQDGTDATIATLKAAACP